MRRKTAKVSGLTFGVVLLFSPFTSAQSKPDASSAAPANRSVSDYPEDEPGILIQAPQWTSIPPEVPSKTRAMRGWAAALSYGAVLANVVSEYAGAHASVQIPPGKLQICICGVFLQGTPVIVKLRGKKDARELNGGRLQPFRGKLSEAQKNDLVPTDISHPEEGVWLVQSADPLPPGEYALMLGTQNVNIFPFTVTYKRVDSSASTEKH